MAAPDEPVPSGLTPRVESVLKQIDEFSVREFNHLVDALKKRHPGMFGGETSGSDDEDPVA